MIIRDPIHQNIELTDSDKRIIDTPQFQRLRGVSQLGTVSLVYPGATHTRFEHSLGVRHIASKMGDILDVSDKELLNTCSLLHDVGHNAFSHILEFDDHETNVIHQMKKPELSEALSDIGVSAKEVADILTKKKKGIITSIIASDIDADRFDYLIRDAYYCGVAYGVIDSKILSELREIDGHIAVTEKGRIPAESVLFARYQMHGVVYNHKTHRIAAAMIRRAAQKALAEEDIKHEDLMVSDEAIVDKLTSPTVNGYTKHLATQFRDRKLYKKALVLRWSDLSEDQRHLALDMRGKEQAIETEIAESLGLQESEVLLDIPKVPILREADVHVLIDGRSVRLGEFSPLANAMTQVYKTFWKFNVYCPKGLEEKVRKKAIGLL